MKKVYLIFSIALLGMSIGFGQTTLTKANNEPIAGDSYTMMEYDSVGTVPKNSGSGLSWNFSSFTSASNSSTSNYSLTSAVPATSVFTGATLLEGDGGGDITVWKSSTSPTTQIEMLGLYNPTGPVELNISGDPLVAAVWPVSFGYSNSDTGTGTVSVQSNTGTVTGNITTSASGSGTITLPGNITFNDVLQVKNSSTLNVVVGSGPTGFTINSVGTTYSYYTGTQKFSVLDVKYENETQTSILGPTVTTTAKIEMNTAVVTGLTDLNFDASYQIYPNPANDWFGVNLTNAEGNSGSIVIYNALGAKVKFIELGNEARIKTRIDVTDLPNGIYIVKTKLGEKSSSRKLIIN